MNIFKSLKNRLEFIYYPKKYSKYIKMNKAPSVMNSIDTLNYIYNNHCSFARFGDGEFELMWGLSLKFQDYCDEIKNDLDIILKSNEKTILIGLPNTYDNLDGYSEQSKRFWQRFMGKYYNQLIDLMPSDYKKNLYGNTNSTRFFTGFTDEDCSEIISLFKRIWDNRNVICIEGQKTRMGVGNDLFDNCKSFKRILGPAKNAYDSHEEIISWIKENVSTENNPLIIGALGPTATVISYKLGLLGYQALDLGHLDIQYEYYLSGSKDKTSIQGKFVNEVSGGSNVSDDIVDDNYLNQIIKDFN